MSEDLGSSAEPTAPAATTKSPSTPQQPKQKGTLLAKIRLGAIIVVAILVTVVLSRNWKTVELDFLGKKLGFPTAILVFLCFFSGLGVGLLLGYFRPWKRSK